MQHVSAREKTVIRIVLSAALLTALWALGLVGFGLGPVVHSA